jgi:hypothetical protein
MRRGQRLRPRPTQQLARLLLGGEPGLAWPDFAALGVTADSSFGVGAIARGRFQDLSLVVLADQASNDDLFTGRYLAVRTLPVDTLDLTQARRNSLLDQPQVQALHRELLQRVLAQNPDVTALLAVGPGAQRLAPRVVPAGMDVIGLAAHGAPGHENRSTAGSGTFPVCRPV